MAAMLARMQSLDVNEIAKLYDDFYVLVPIYAVMVPILQKVYQGASSESSKGWKPIILAYNVIMSVFSACCAIGMAYILFVKFNGQIKGPDCSAFARDPLYDWIVYFFYMSKYVEFADTFFLIIKGKPVSWLHYFHHIGAAIDMGVLWKSGAEPTWIFVLFNGTVHTVMYAYYGAALMGKRLKGKNLITIMQIVQFLSGMGIFYTYPDIPCFASNSQLMFIYYYTNIYVGIVLLFFLNFYVQSYLRPQRKAPGKSE
uniref:Elongation of fatty acids protein n=1 Tax=Schizochytrium sp. TaxID=1907177 RepID=A0AA96SIC7_9STRA|nr:elongase [Schizochytrium sp.]|mmetsp:Transcript_17734/g.34957  ORF Transcript_17734/g.34957 Transcript_17734/m.34957 type:complete len:256 (+) Transcript_17734:267-1034(+)|eukprot:CAMPEP_0171509380 /NCGR_PEP_ID=MMETSP0958-20121227/14744_1 /TAXON_ID=87120 /ORGANISM="Aurantiochytrium limacinum, Strain ATCCMYA-1381" /LENGTH=255 /DNA_ID=CAMNT_0012046625 /DNA_START=152 /DNA_END=919 /DNA_ORIENTATION=-